MSRVPELDIRVSIDAIAAFAGDGRIYRAYAHAIAAARGMVLLVPIELVAGDITDLIDACPVPWEEVIAIIEEPDRDARPLAEWVRTILGAPLRALAPTHWDEDWVPFAGAVLTRLSHPSGIRLAVLAALLAGPTH